MLVACDYSVLSTRFNTCQPYFKVDSKITRALAVFIMNLLLLFHAHNQTQHTRTYRHKYIRQLTVVLVYLIVYTCLLNTFLVDDIIYSVNKVKYIIITIYVLYCQLKGADRLEHLCLLWTCHLDQPCFVETLLWQSCD